MGKGRGDRVISSIGRAHSTIDSPCIVIDAEAEDDVRGTKRRIDALLSARERLALDRGNEDE